MRPRRVLLVCSSGGHLAQLHLLEPWWSRHDRRWVTFDKADARSLLADEQTVWAFHPTTRNIPNLLRNLVLAWRVLADYAPDLVVSTGAGVALPFIVLARLRRIRTAYLEVYDRIDLPTLTGRLCYPVVDVFLVQWERQKVAYPRATLVGAMY